MLNFALGTLAGGAVVTVALAVGLRQPRVLDRLDLAPKAVEGVALVRRSEPPACPPSGAAATASAQRPQPVEPLFAPRRFWFVAP